MNRRDFLLGLAVAAVWGANFTIIKLGLSDMPSMLFVSLRYFFTAFPAVLFVKRPPVKWRYIIGYGLSTGTGQFGCLFYAIEMGMPAGVASIVLQAQAFFTCLFAVFILKERLEKRQVIGLAVAAAGLFFIAGFGANPYNALPAVPFFVTLLGAMFWGVGNIAVRLASQESAKEEQAFSMLGLVVWSSLFAFVPLLALALLFDPPGTLVSSLVGIGPAAMLAIIYQALLANIFGFGIWGSLIAKYSASRIAPLSLLVPVTGFLTAWAVFGETIATGQFLGAVVVVSGVFLINMPKRARCTPFAGSFIPVNTGGDKEDQGEPGAGFHPPGV